MPRTISWVLAHKLKQGDVPQESVFYWTSSDGEGWELSKGKIEGYENLSAFQTYELVALLPQTIEVHGVECTFFLNKRDDGWESCYGIGEAREVHGLHDDIEESVGQMLWWLIREEIVNFKN